MNAHQARYANLMALFNQFKADNAHLPDRGMLKLFAEKLELSDRYLSHVKCGRKQIGNSVARQIEQRMGRPAGWMDMPHEGQNAVDDDAQMIIDMILAAYKENPSEVRKLVVDFFKTKVTATAKTR